MGRVRPRLSTLGPLGRLATAAILAALALSARADAIEDFAKLNDEARAARAAGDIVARERCIERIRSFLNDAPNAVRVAAQVYAEAGDQERMFAALEKFAELGRAPAPEYDVSSVACRAIWRCAGFAASSPRARWPQSTSHR